MVILLMIRTVSDQKIKIMRWKQVSIRFWNTRSSLRFYNWPFLLVRVLIRSPALHSVTFYQLQIPSQHFHFVCSTYLMIVPVSVPDPASKTLPFPQMLQQCPVTVCQVICNIYPDLSGHGMEQVTQQTMTLSVLRMTHRDKIPAFPAQLWPLSSAFMIITAQREEIIEKNYFQCWCCCSCGSFSSTANDRQSVQFSCFISLLHEGWWMTPAQILLWCHNHEWPSYYWGSLHSPELNQHWFNDKLWCYEPVKDDIRI